ncbi:MAG: redoxin family protein [Isosphaeraceae bacterium]
MKTHFKKPWMVAILGGFMVSAGAVLAADRSADQILKDIDAVKLPQYDGTKRGDQAYVREFMTKRQEAASKRATLILELYKAAPEHERMETLLPERWGSMSPIGPQADDLTTEINDVAAHAVNPKLKLEATYYKAQLGLFKGRSAGKFDISGVDEFIKLAPKDRRAPALLYSATMAAKDEKVKAGLQERLLKEFPGSQYGEMVKSARRQLESVGKPFDLDFTDAIKGSTVSIKNLKGKVVVIDFWATWCGPCVAEMPHMKELYAKYRDQGVEFIGVSLDRSKEQGGLDSLKKYVKDNGIEWPQYFQGNYWQSEFSKSWGINSIPTMFLVDTEGKLFSVDARGKLDKLIPELLKKKAHAAVGAGAGGQ